MTGESVFQLVESLGPKLKSKQVNERIEALESLTIYVIQNQHSLKQDEVFVLVNFYQVRINDSSLLLKSTLKALRVLLLIDTVEAAQLTSCLRTLFKEQHIQSLVLSERTCVFSLLTDLFKSRLNAMQSVSSELVLWFVQAVDGERDPRNLVLIFQLVPVLVTNCALGPYAEEVFDVISCYFPIEFTPPTESSITQNQLSLSLRNALTSCEAFAPSILGLVEENLSAKDEEPFCVQESLSLILLALSRFEPDTVRQYAKDLWRGLRKQIAVAQSEAVRQAPLKCALEMVQKLLDADFKEVGKISPQTDSFFAFILDDSEPFIQNPNLKLVSVFDKLLMKIASLHPVIRSIFDEKLIPLFMTKVQSSDVISEDQMMYASLLSDHLCGLSVHVDESHQSWLPGLYSALHALVPLLPTVDGVRFNVAAAMLRLDSVNVSDDTCHDLMQTMSSVWLSIDVIHRMADNMRTSICRLSREINNVKPKLFNDFITTQLKTEPKFGPFVALLTSNSTHNNILPLLVSITSDDSRMNIQVLTELLQNLLFAFRQQRNDADRDFVDALVSFLISQFRLGSQVQYAISLQDLLTEAHRSDLVCAVIDSEIANVQNDNLNLSQLILLSFCLPLFNDNDKTRHESLKYVFNSVNSSCGSSKSPECQTAIKVCALLVTKLKLDFDISSLSFENHCVFQTFYALKALLISNSCHAEDLLDKCFSCLQSHKDDQEYFDGFCELLNLKSDRHFGSDFYRPFPLFAKQRIFTLFASLLLKHCELNDSGCHYLRIMRLLFDAAAENDISLELAKLLPVVVKSILNDDLDVAESGLSALESILGSTTSDSTECQYLRVHVVSLVNRLLELSAMSMNASLKLRKSAVDILGLLASLIPFVDIFPCRKTVLKELKIPLDDPKRLVRNAATKTRNKWFVVAAK